MILTPADVHQFHVRTGFLSGNCSGCMSEPEPISWHALARANRLPPMVVGGSDPLRDSGAAPLPPGTSSGPGVPQAA